MGNVVILNPNANALVGAKPIEDAGKALPLTLMLCVNSLNYHWNTLRRFDANALCERTLSEI